jgi:phospholipid transport system substrate-binding protein
LTRTTFSSDFFSITRRSLLIGAGAAVMAPDTARAMTQTEARDLIGVVMADVARIIDSGGSDAQIVREFEALFERYGDVPVIAQSVLGPPARQASRAQMAAFTDAFRGYMARKYGGQFRRFRGARADVTGAREVQRYWEVISTMTLRGEAPFEVRWHVSDRSGQQKFFNMIIEGVNLLAAERQEIGTMLEQRRGDIDALTRDLRSAG